MIEMPVHLCKCKVLCARLGFFPICACATLSRFVCVCAHLGSVSLMV